MSQAPSPWAEFPLRCPDGKRTRPVGESGAPEHLVITVGLAWPGDRHLGYGLSGGKGYIWVCLPFLNDAGNELAITWWGDRPQYRADSTVAFAKRAVPEICRLFSGDSERVLLSGFFRGALACNAIGNHNDGWLLRPSPARDAARAWLARVQSK